MFNKVTHFTLLTHFTPLYPTLYLQNRICSLFRQVSKEKIPPYVRALTIELSCDNADDEDVKVPYVKYILPKTSATNGTN